ncbi:rod shape-determining protein [Plantactinospora sonchi]|uniref:Rod shape-determining protein n=1 Tax=Plantactinospora sonchi TaxID=1544735 RepID=A0ABU7RRU3_9ACTN
MASTLLAVDFGSTWLRAWGLARGTASFPTADGPSAAPLVRRGRLVDPSGCTAALRRLRNRLGPAAESRPLVVACRPVLATPGDEQTMREVLTAALDPRRVLFIDTVRAAAIGSGAAAGDLLIADIGAQVTEVGLLSDGHLVTARRANLGTGDLTPDVTVHVLAAVAARLVREVYQQPDHRPAALAALARGMVLVGDGAARPELTVALARALRIGVHPAATPYTAALTGAGLAAMAAARHPVPS